MTAVLGDLAPTAAEREQPPLVAEVERIRTLLTAFRNGETVPPRPASAVVAAFEPAIDRLARLCRLSAFERDVILLAAAIELDADAASLVAALAPEADPRPTFGLALAMLPDAHWDALAPRSPLRRWRLVELGSGPTLASAPLRIDERILHFLTGLDAPDERLDGVLARPAPVPLGSSQERLARELAHAVAVEGARALVAIDGDDADVLTGVARSLALALDRTALIVRANALPPAGRELADVARLIDREALLLEGLPILEAEGAVDAVCSTFLAVLEAPRVAVLGGHAFRAPGRVVVRGLVALPSPGEGRALWAAALDPASARALAKPIEEVAQHFRLNPAAIAAVARELAATATDESEKATTLRRLCRERTRLGLDGLAERIETSASWQDIVLPDGHLELLREIARHVRHRTQVYERWEFGARTTRGLGVTALFAGESGTGKTLAAEVLAGELGLDLYRIDLAATVSKYVGETEKNLRRLFAAAECSGAVLLFDEADALFGKRGEVKDGHDRYANLEVAYLLQRMETYRGLAILTTNLRSQVDRAFLRRLRFVVQFPFPDAEQRAEIWRRTLPAAAPVDGVDPERIARLAMAGGSIRSIALSAAFGAAEAGTPITRWQILRAARFEAAKAERALTDAELEALA